MLNNYAASWRQPGASTTCVRVASPAPRSRQGAPQSVSLSFALHEAVDRVARAIVQHKTRVIDIDLRSYFDNVRPDRLLAKVARRDDDADVMRLLKIMLKANGQRGVPQGGVISPLLSNPYLTEVDGMPERAKKTTRVASTPTSSMHGLQMIW